MIPKAEKKDLSSLGTSFLLNQGLALNFPNLDDQDQEIESDWLILFFKPVEVREVLAI